MSDGSERLHALDAVRGFALVAGIFFHATASFVPSETPMWMIWDEQRSPALGYAFFVLHIFRMTTFFVIAGFFARMMYHRRGLAGFARDRGKRIALPLVAGWPVIFAAIVGAVIAGTLIKYGGPPPFTPPEPPEPPLLAFPLTHLWFLYVLLVLYVVGVGGRMLVAAVDKDERLRSLVDRGVGGLVRTGLAPVVLAIPVTAALVGHVGWIMWAGIPTPDNSLIPNLPAFAEYGMAFLFGWLLHRQTDLLATIQRWWPMHLTVAIAATLAALWQLNMTPSPDTDVPSVNPLAYAACYALAAWTWTFALIGMALRFLSGFSAWRRYLADASYWLYLIHLPLVILAQGVVAKYPWPAELKYLLMLAVLFPLMLASYELMVRYTWLGAILNGRRHPRPGKARIPATSAQAIEQEPTR